MPLDPDLQPREQIDLLTVEEYAQVIKTGDVLPPVAVFFDGAAHWLADGYHRWYAHKALELPEIAADVYQGDKVAAVRYSLAANARHGKRREPGDLRKAYRIAVRHGHCAADDPDAVRALLGCTDRWARTLTQLAREAAEEAWDAVITRLAGQRLSTRQIAEETGVPQQTVSRIAGSDPKRNSSILGQGTSTTLYSPGAAGKGASLPPDLSRRFHVVDLDDEDPDPDPDSDPPTSPLAHLANPASARWSGFLHRLDVMNEQLRSFAAKSWFVIPVLVNVTV